MDYKFRKKLFDKLKNDRKTWDNMYQVVGEYVSQVKQNFENSPQAGEFLVEDVFDSTGSFAAHNSASALLGMLWHGSAKQSIEISAPDGLEMTGELADYYARMTETLVGAMDDPKANLGIALMEYMADQLIFGTSGVGVESGDDSLLMFKPYGVKELYIDEGKNGQVDELYLLFEWTIKRIVDEYGLENVSEKIKEKYEDKQWLERAKVLICIYPRIEKKADAGVLAMPYETVHLEYDNECHVLKESGFSSLPIKVGRFKKLNYERYGRSPAMDALPDIREANVLREAVIIATEKNLDPPLGIMDDGALGGGVVDTSAGSISVFNGAMNNGNPVFPLVTVGSIPDALARLESLRESIAQHFHLDRLLDFNNQTQMTFGEAQIRNGIRNASLASLYMRQISEVLTPLIERCGDILFQLGEFGVIEGSEQETELKALGKDVYYIPDILVERMENEQDIYQIVYKTQAANAQRSEEYIAILDVLSFAIQATQIDPTVRHRYNLHEGIKVLGNIRGLPVDILRQDDEVEALIQAENQQAMQMQGMAMAEQGANVVEKMANARETVRG